MVTDLKEETETKVEEGGGVEGRNDETGRNEKAPNGTLSRKL